MPSDCCWFLVVRYQTTEEEDLLQFTFPVVRGSPSAEAEGCCRHRLEEESAELHLLLYPSPLLHQWSHKPQQHLLCPAPLVLASYLLPSEKILRQWLPLGFPSLLRKGVCPNPLLSVGAKVGSPFERSSQELPSCCKEL